MRGPRVGGVGPANSRARGGGCERAPSRSRRAPPSPAAARRLCFPGCCRVCCRVCFRVCFPGAGGTLARRLRRSLDALSAPRAARLRSFDGKPQARRGRGRAETAGRLVRLHVVARFAARRRSGSARNSSGGPRLVLERIPLRPRARARLRGAGAHGSPNHGLLSGARMTPTRRALRPAERRRFQLRRKRALFRARSGLFTGRWAARLRPAGRIGTDAEPRASAGPSEARTAADGAACSGSVGRACIESPPTSRQSPVLDPGPRGAPPAAAADDSPPPAAAGPHLCAPARADGPPEGPLGARAAPVGAAPLRPDELHERSSAMCGLPGWLAPNHWRQVLPRGASSPARTL